MTATAYIGTSGFSYSHWKDDFYEGVPQKRWLEHYAEHFPTVEINNTFYHLTKASTLEGWRDRTPDDFIFVTKVSRLISHSKKLADCDEYVANYLDRVELLGDKLGPLLVQLPPSFEADPDVLDAFLKMLPNRHRVAVEFRNPSWLTDEVYAVLRDADAALVIHDQIDDHPREVTAGWVYWRRHGPEGGDTGYSYQQLTAEAEQIADWLADGRDVYVYFNNDVGGHAPRDAAKLVEYVADRKPESVPSVGLAG